MSVELAIFKWCQQNSTFEYRVQGSMKEPYIIRFNGNVRNVDIVPMWSCTCSHFKYSSKPNFECKHIVEAKEKKCDWGFDAVSGSPSYIDGNECPECGGPLAAVEVAV